MVTRWEHSVLLEKRVRIYLHGGSPPATADPGGAFQESLFTRGMVVSGAGNVVAYDLNAEGDRLIVAQSAIGTTAAESVNEPERLILVQNFFEELRQVVPD